ncbi:hypothetical protein ACEQ38_09205 [Ralstonia syzygii subsp. celebesensis]|uniref:Uncharacterized protein n=2 Tax=Ralstonia syzygii subsp. celebesensis TaxID=1310168 RepID=A0A1U9VEE6_9RALS|nr:hypothetical protein [Ralstonia syzygii]AQW29048.1 hypothetical protein B0B51_02765 [blood disease bacterium A2-HR MARDI]QQV54409.1 hypothetical protein JK151_09355 [Ralstonia syzygii subsp. celebesensis]CCA79310.1 exported hypothetical protein [blood disease bacterium R229]
MNAHLFNACLLIGWLLVLAGGCLVHVGYGLAFAGLLLLVVVLFVSRMAGVYLPGGKTDGEP